MTVRRPARSLRLRMFLIAMAWILGLLGVGGVALDRVLSYLMHHQGRVVPRTELVEHIYDQDFDRDSNTIEVFITRIRKKLGAELISTTRGLGYSLNDI